MVTETEGIILRQTKTAYGRRMVTLLSDKYGKISAGTSISERGRTKSALALRPFTYGRYELFKGRDSYSINGAETIESFYSIGEDIDKYAAAGAALELTDKLLEEGDPADGSFNLLLDLLKTLEQRKNEFATPLIAFKIRSLELFGSGIRTDSCVRCGKTDGLRYLSVPDGGLVCGDCLASPADLNPLIFEISDDIISIIRFMQTHPVRSLEGLTIPEKERSRLMRMLNAYYSYHSGIDSLKSESLIL